MPRSFDLFGDEVIYTDLGRSVISGGFPRFDGPFFLHGPGFFYLEAGWERSLGYPVSLMGWVYEMRALNALLAGATAVVLVLLRRGPPAHPGRRRGGSAFRPGAVLHPAERPGSAGNCA